MIIYLVYEKFYADFSNGEDDAVFIECAYKSKRKAIKRAKSLINESKQYNFFVDECIKNKRNPFKNNNCVDLYRNKTEQEQRVKSIILEEIKLIA